MQTLSLVALFTPLAFSSCGAPAFVPPSVPASGETPVAPPVATPTPPTPGAPTPSPSPVPSPVPSPAPVPPPSPAPPPVTPPTAPAPAPGTPDVVREVLALTNAARAQARTCGTRRFGAAGPLTLNATLGSVAQKHAQDMRDRNYFDHVNPEGLRNADRVTAAGYRWRAVAENIAWGASTAQAVVAGWVDSPGHCANIMNPELKELGVGYVAGGNRRHLWVQVFAAPR